MRELNILFFVIVYKKLCAHKTLIFENWDHPVQVSYQGRYSTAVAEFPRYRGIGFWTRGKILPLR